MGSGVSRWRQGGSGYKTFFMIGLFFIAFISISIASVLAQATTSIQKEGKSDYITIKHRSIKDLLEDADHLYSIGKYEEALALYNYISDITRGEYLGEDFISKKKKEKPEKLRTLKKAKPKRAKKQRVLKKAEPSKPIVLQKEEPKKLEKSKKLKPVVPKIEKPKKLEKPRVLKKEEFKKVIILPKPEISKPKPGKPKVLVERFILTERDRKEIDALYKKAIPYYKGSLALFYHSQEKLDKSKEIFEQILAIDPTQKKARLYIDKKIPARKEKIERRIQKMERRELK